MMTRTFVSMAFVMWLSVSFAMPAQKDLDVASAKVRSMMVGFRSQPEMMQTDMALKASESAKSEAERLLLIRGAYLKYVREGEYDKAADALDVLQVRVSNIPESYIKDMLAKGLDKAPIGNAVRLAEVKRSIEGGIPRILHCEPANGAVNVSAKTDKIVIWFDRPMSKSCSLCGKSENCPVKTGDPSLDESGRIISIPVTLVPNKAYRMSLNSKNFKNFKSAAGISLIPFSYGFTTGSC